METKIAFKISSVETTVMVTARWQKKADDATTKHQNILTWQDLLIQPGKLDNNSCILYPGGKITNISELYYSYGCARHCVVEFSTRMSGYHLQEIL